MADLLTVQQALAAVMGDVQAIRKESRNQNQNYNFRGIDAVVNAVGPALRKHGVLVLPQSEEATYESYASKQGGAMKGCVVKVRFVFVGPAGDTLECSVYGEASDSGDKATPKAHSVAFRTALLEALCIPTDEPDPDSHTYEREIPAPEKRRVKPTAAGPALPAATDTQYQAISSLLDDLNAKEKTELLAWWSGEGFGSLKLKTLSALHADKVIGKLYTLLEARKEATGTGDTDAPSPKAESTVSPVLPLPVKV